MAYSQGNWTATYGGPNGGCFTNATTIPTNSFVLIGNLVTLYFSGLAQNADVNDYINGSGIPAQLIPPSYNPLCHILVNFGVSLQDGLLYINQDGTFNIGANLGYYTFNEGNNAGFNGFCVTYLLG
jgi:hypothetical protein